MQTIEQFLKYREICPVCQDMLGVILYGEFGSLSLIQKNDHFVYRRVVNKRIVDGGGIDYVADIKLNIFDNNITVDFLKDLYSEPLTNIPIKTIKKFRTYETNNELVSNYIITNACYNCSYEYWSDICVNWKTSSFNVNPIRTEIFTVFYPECNEWTYINGELTHKSNFAIVNNILENSSEVLTELDTTYFSLRHVVNRKSGKFDLKYVKTYINNADVIELPNTYCDPTNIDKLTKELNVLYLFS